MSQVKGIKWKNETYEFVSPDTLEDYDTSEQVNVKIADAVTGLTSGDEVDKKIDDALDGYYDKDEVDEKLDNINALEVESYNEKDESGKETEIVRRYAMIETTRGDVPTSVVNVEYLDSRLANTGGGSSGEGVDLSNYYTKEETYSRVETDNAIATAINNVAGIKIASGSYDTNTSGVVYNNGLYSLKITTSFTPRIIFIEHQQVDSGSPFGDKKSVTALSNMPDTNGGYMTLLVFESNGFVVYGGTDSMGDAVSTEFLSPNYLYNWVAIG